MKRENSIIIIIAIEGKMQGVNVKVGKRNRL